MALLKAYAGVVFVLAEQEEDEKEECAIMPATWSENIDQVSTVFLWLSLLAQLITYWYHIKPAQHREKLQESVDENEHGFKEKNVCSTAA